MVSSLFEAVGSSHNTSLELARVDKRACSFRCTSRPPLQPPHLPLGLSDRLHGNTCILCLVDGHDECAGLRHDHGGPQLLGCISTKPLPLLTFASLRHLQGNL